MVAVAVSFGAISVAEVRGIIRPPSPGAIGAVAS
jgi:hypothetical protein